MPPATLRQGTPLLILGREVPFSFWPVGRTTRRYGAQYRIFSTNPWPTITRSIQRSCPSTAKPSALAFIAQAEDYYRAATSGTVSAAKPLLLYYAFMNMAKAYILHVGRQNNLDHSAHGVSEQLGPGGIELTDAILRARPTAPPVALPDYTSFQLFHEFLHTARGTGLAARTDFPVPKLLPQIITGHRLWAHGAHEIERFVGFHRISFVENRPGHEIWLRLFIFHDDLTRLGVSHLEFLRRAQLATDFHAVVWNEQIDHRSLVCFEQRVPTTYTHRSADVIPELVSRVRTAIWTAVSSQSPYRKYYAYMAPTADHAHTLPQVLSIYAVAFYLGSITRYRPHHFQKIIDSDFGPFIEAFLNDQPAQFLYLMASLFAKQEITKAAIV